MCLDSFLALMSEEHRHFRGCIFREMMALTVKKKNPAKINLKPALFSSHVSRLGKGLFFLSSVLSPEILLLLKFCFHA